MVVFGLGGIGLNVVQGARMVGANKIIGVDLNPRAQALAEKFGMTHFVNPKEVEGDLVAHLVDAHRTAARTTASSASATSTSCARRSSAATAAGACR